MAAIGRRMACAAALAAMAAAWHGCTSPSEASIRIEPEELAFTHIIGTSPCPQLVGRFTIRNIGNQSVPLASLDVSGPLTASPTQGDIPPGGSIEITVFFNCTLRSDFIGSVGVDVGEGASTARTVTVRGTVR